MFTFLHVATLLLWLSFLIEDIFLTPEPEWHSYGSWDGGRYTREAMHGTTPVDHARWDRASRGGDAHNFSAGGAGGGRGGLGGFGGDSPASARAYRKFLTALAVMVCGAAILLGQQPRVRRLAPRLAPILMDVRCPTGPSVPPPLPSPNV